MALFQTVQKIYETIAIHPSLWRSNQFCSLNVKIQFFLINTLQTLIASTAFFSFKANTIQLLADSFYVSLTHAVALFYISITIWKVADILQLIDKCEKFIEKSESMLCFLFSLEKSFISIWKHYIFLFRYRIIGFDIKRRNVCWSK